MDYKTKYLKYKNKYLKLKNQIGGDFKDIQIFYLKSNGEKSIKIISIGYFESTILSAIIL